GTADGLDLLDRASDSFTHYRHNRQNPDSLDDSSVFSLYQDTAGLVWIGTATGGVSRWDPRSGELGARQPDWLGKFVTAFADAPDERVWIASMGGGLVEYDPNSGRKVDLKTVIGHRGALDSEPVMSLRQDRSGVLWIGTMDKGVATLDRAGTLKWIPVKRGDPHSLSAAGVMSLFQARD